MIGAAGLAGVLGTGTYVLTNDSADRSDPVPQAAVSGDPAEPASASSASPGGSAASWPKTAASRPKTAAERVAAARSAAAKTGVPVRHPLAAQVTDTGAIVADVTTTGSQRVVTARGDLTGRRELAWVAGGVTKHGDAGCSQTFRFSSEARAETKPNLLVCWRTSAEKSVIVAAADADGNPSERSSLATIEREWRKLG
ncbi:MAG TPA: hypothetical protein VFR35_04795 [Actinoplanes sp.]|nr:hypothetical protein [Actinoplanes sp.]